MGFRPSDYEERWRVYCLWREIKRTQGVKYTWLYFFDEEVYTIGLQEMERQIKLENLKPIGTRKVVFGLGSD